MFPLSPDARALLNATVALTLAPLVVALALLWKGRRTSPWPVRLGGVAVSAWLAIVFVLPKEAGITVDEVAGAIRAAQDRGETSHATQLASLAVQHHSTDTRLPNDVLELLFRAQRFDDLEHYFDRILPRDARAESLTALLILARLVRSGRWDHEPVIEQVAADARGRPDLAAGAELLARAAPAGAAPRDLPDYMFAGGIRTRGTAIPRGTFEGWGSWPAGNAQCDVLVYFIPVSGNQVWLHAYPAGSRDYINIGSSLPASEWTPGEAGWEVFRLPGSSQFNLYAGIADGDDLGPAVPLGTLTCRVN